VDYNDAGVMKRLPVTDATASAGTVTKIPNNDKGVWVEGNARTEGSFSATVKLFTATAEVAGACAYASNYPPVGKYISASEISFTGTPEYKVVLERSDKSTYTVIVNNDESLSIPNGEAVMSFTDKTGAPGMLVPATYTLSGSNGCEGIGVTLTLSGSQKGWKYQLYKGSMAIGNVVDGTGNALAFPDAPAAGNFNYTVWTVNNSAVTAQRAMQVSNVRAITVNALPAAPTITASAATVCQNGVLRFTVPYAANTTYTWTASAGTSSNNSYTFNTSTTGAKTATVRLTVLADGTTCQSGNAATVTATVNPMPTISLRSGTASQSVKLTAAITAIVYTATNSATISRTGGGFPNGVTGVASSSSFTISGTPSATGTFNYSLTAAVGGCNSAAAGTLTVLSAPPGAASTYIWVIGSQLWSAPLQKAQAGCTATKDFGETNPPPVAYYRTSGLYDGSGYLYNWKCVDDYATQLCPSPWRVPTYSDFQALDWALGGSGSNRTDEDPTWITAKYVNLWGGAYGGYGLNAFIHFPGSIAHYWTTYRTTDYAAASLQFLSVGTVKPIDRGCAQAAGFQVRCVH
jgi:uncharacterized protein (TIGR02145 family)